MPFSTCSLVRLHGRGALRAIRSLLQGGLFENVRLVFKEVLAVYAAQQQPTEEEAVDPGAVPQAPTAAASAAPAAPPAVPPAWDNLRSQVMREDASVEFIRDALQSISEEPSVPERLRPEVHREVEDRLGAVLAVRADSSAKTFTGRGAGGSREGGPALRVPRAQSSPCTDGRGGHRSAGGGRGYYCHRR